MISKNEAILNDFTQKIVRQFAPLKIILFGSRAWGKAGAGSDFDLFIIKETDDTRGLARQIDGFLWGRTAPLDIIVYRPEQVQKRLAMGDFFVRNIVTKGKVLYEQS